MKIEYKINDGLPMGSFLLSPEISFHLTRFFEQYETRFSELKGVTVDLKEKVQIGTADIKPREMGKLRGGNLNILVPFSSYPGANGVMKSPDANAVFEQLRFVIEKEIEHYAKYIDRINPPLELRLKQLGIDLASEKDIVANELKGSLGLAGYKLDFGKRIAILTPEDLYQLGTVIIVSDTGGKVFSKDQVISDMEKKLQG